LALDPSRCRARRRCRHARDVAPASTVVTVLEAARDAANHLAESTAAIALVGGLAVSARAEPRNTRDVDFAVAAPGDHEAELIVRSLVAQGYGIVAVLEQDRTGRLATVRLRQAGTGAVVVDLLFASSGIEREVAAEAERLEIAPGVALPVARTGHLIAMKLLSRDDVTRPQDRVDLASLLLTASEQEIERATGACKAIDERGCARGRDLELLLREAVATWRR